MASHLTRDEVVRIADLARLDLSPSELDTFAPQLADILAYAATVQQADTTGSENFESSGPQNPGTPEPPNPGTSEPPNPGTSEPPNPGTPEPRNPGTPITRAAVLAEAPDGVRESGLFRVPKVF